MRHAAAHDPSRLRNRIFLWSTPLLLVGMASSIVRGVFLAVMVCGVYLATRWRRPLLHGAVFAIVGLSAASLVATYFEVFPMDLFFWLLLGVLGSLWIDSSSTRSRSDHPEAASRPTSVSSSTPSLA